MECNIVEVGRWINKSKGIFKRNEYMSLEEYNNIDKSVAGLFRSAYSYSNKNIKESLLYGDLYFDFDSDDFNKVKEDAVKTLNYLKIVFKIDYNTDDVKIFFSGKKGIHITVNAEILGIDPIGNLNVIYKCIANAINNYLTHKTLDLRVYDNKRVFRVENSIHESSRLFKVQITYAELFNMSYDEICFIALTPRVFENRNKAFKKTANAMLLEFINKASEKVSNRNIKANGNNLKYCPPCVKTILEDGVCSGNRNNTIAALASYYKSTGIDSNQCLQKILDFNKEKVYPNLGEGEIRTTIYSIYMSKNTYGCSAFKEISVCNKECKFYKMI